MSLATSQLAVLKAVEEATDRPGTWRAGARWVATRLGISEQAAYRRLRRLEVRRYLASSFGNRRIAFYLTQQGKEALTAGDKGEAGSNG